MASSLTTVGLVEDHLGISSGAGGDALTTIVAGVNEGLENMLGDTFTSATYTNEVYDTPGGSRVLQLRHFPVTAFSQLQSKDDPTDFADTSWTTVDTSDYTVDLGSGTIYMLSKFPRRKAGYRATYTAGYASIPADLQLAATMIASNLYQNRSTSGVKSETLGQYSRTFTESTKTWKDLGIDMLLSKYLTRGWFTDGFRA